MNIRYWIEFIMVFSLGVILVQISHGKMLNTEKLNIHFSASFLRIIRYLGLFIIIYSGYGVIIEYVITS